MRPLSLLPQDVVVLAKLLVYAQRRPSLVRMAVDLVSQRVSGACGARTVWRLHGSFSRPPATADRT